MTFNIATPWHKASFEHFLNERLPELLNAHLPLTSYTITPTGRYSYQMRIALSSASSDVEVVYTDLPQPDDDGIFKLDDQAYVVVPCASNADLDTASIDCVGEQLAAYIEKRLGQAPPDLVWDASFAHAWFPFDAWMHEFFAPAHHRPIPSVIPQHLDETNWLARQSHLRRLYTKNRNKLFAPSQLGRTCPFETPEGPNIGRIWPIALGAEIRDGKLVIIDDQPEATLGLAAAMIPLLEHDNPSGLLMGANMLRQWLIPSEPEPALVQSGNEPDVPHFWCGRNLLTAFVSWDADTFEDAIVISQSCARRLDYPTAVAPGDKLSNRHGTKGVVSRILPDDEMPHLADGTPVELVFNFISLHARLYIGQLREAVLGRIAHTTGTPIIAPPFHAPDEKDICARLAEAGLSEDGMETLTLGRYGTPLLQPSTVGWVYWGKLFHTARGKIHSPVHSSGQKLNHIDYYALRNSEAFENILEHFNTRAIARTDAVTLIERVAVGNIAQSAPPSPQFSELARCLAIVGIHAELVEGKLTFHLARPQGATLALARPVLHPWLHNHTLSEIGVCEELPAYASLVEANTRLQRIVTSHAPESLIQQAFTQLETRVRALCDALLTSEHVHFSMRSLFTGRAVLTPGIDLRLDQLGLSEDIAWELFMPSVRRAIGDEETSKRSAEAIRVLDEIMAASWIIVHRAPAFTPQTFLAFHPVRYADQVIRLHPLACRLLQADFDGDQAAIYLPITKAAQDEAGAKLSIAGHLSHVPGLLKALLPTNESLWGLAHLSLTHAGLREIAEIVGVSMTNSNGLLTQEVLAEIMQRVLERDGTERTLTILERLARRGFEVAKASGASLGPFADFATPDLPLTTHITSIAWDSLMEELIEQLEANCDYKNDKLGAQLLAIKSGARGETRRLAWLTHGHSGVRNVYGQPIPIRHGYRDGLTPDELFALAVETREAFASIHQEWEQIERDIQDNNVSKSFHVLARAMRARYPGIVFAHAASINESDPLVDIDSRLFVGLPPLTQK